MDHHDTNSGESMLIAHQVGMLQCQLHNCSIHTHKKEKKGGGGGLAAQINVIHLPFVHVHYSIFRD